MKKQFEGEMEYYITAIRKRWKTVLLIPIILGIIVGVIGILEIKEEPNPQPAAPKYQASTTLLINNKSLGNVGANQVFMASNTNIIHDKQITYSTIAKSRVLINMTIKELDLKMTPEELSSKIVIPDMPNSEVLTFNYLDNNSDSAIKILNSLAANFIVLATKFNEVDNVKILDPAVITSVIRAPAVSQAIPKITKIITYILESILLGLVISTGLALLLEKLRLKEQT